MLELKGKVITRIAIAWQHCIVLELTDELKSLPFRQRAIAFEYIYERCLRYAGEQVNKKLEKPGIASVLEESYPKHFAFILLADHINSQKYIERIIKQIRDLLPRWQANEMLDIKDFYQELHPRKPSLGKHEGCGGEVIESGSYYRCRHCKTVGHKIRENLEGNIVLLTKEETS